MLSFPIYKWPLFLWWPQYSYMCAINAANHTWNVTYPEEIPGTLHQFMSEGRLRRKFMVNFKLWEIKRSMHKLGWLNSPVIWHWDSLWGHRCQKLWYIFYDSACWTLGDSMYLGGLTKHSAFWIISKCCKNLQKD